MGWGGATISALLAQGTIPLSFVLKVRRNAAGGGVGDELVASSRSDHGADLALLPRSYISQPASLRVQSWSLQVGVFSIDVMLPSLMTGRSPLAGKSLRRGALVELLAGDGPDVSAYLPIRRGRIQNVTPKGRHRATVQIYSLLYSLKGRPYPTLDADDLPQTRLFTGLCGVETLLTSDYTAGDTTLNLTDASSFQTFDGTGVVKVVGDSGVTFYLEFTGKSSNQLTGVSASAEFDTTEEDATVAAGAAAWSVAYLGGEHPITIARRLLTSTGAGTNGPEDVYPEAAGFALDAEWIDEGQFRMVRTTVTKVTSGNYNWDVLVESPVEDGLLWLQGLLADAGIWLTERQGQIVPRAAQSLTSANPVGQFLSITDADIIGQPTIEWYDPSVPYAYNRFQPVTNDGSVDESVLPATTLPVRDELIADVSDRVFSNQNAIRLEMVARMDDYAHYIGEVITLTLRSAWWGLCEGDVIPLTTQRIRGRFQSTYAGYDARTCLVLSADAQPIESTTTVKLLCMPLTPGDDHG